MIRSFRLFAALFAALSLAAAPSLAQSWQNGPPPAQRLVYKDLSVIRLNPLGLITDSRITYRWRLYRHESAALRDNFVSIGLAPVLSPAYLRAGLQLELQPLSILTLWAMYETVQYLGILNFMQSFPSAASPVSDTLIRELGGLDKADPRKNYASFGTQLNLGANFQVKVKDIVVRSMLRFARPDFELRANDRVLYDIVFDSVVKNRGWVGANDADVLWQSSWGLTVGARWTWTRAFHDADSFAPGETAADISTNRVGPLVAYTFNQEDGASFNTPTILVVMNWWTSHPWRTGQDVSQAMPYLVVGFAFTGDLLGVKPD